MINILWDGNYLAHSEFSVFSQYGKSKDPLKSERNKSNFIHGLTTKFFYALNQLPKGGRVVFCMDSKSWRKGFYSGYKSSREDVDGNKGQMDRATKEIFYSLMEDFCEMLKKVGIFVCRVPGAEGDDLLFHWSKYFNDKGENVIIVTGDRDMTQCIAGPKEPWTIVWTNKSNSNKLYIPEHWTDWIIDVSNSVFNFTLNNDQEVMSKLIRDQELKLEHTQPEFYVLKKILIGDDGDDVPAVWTVYKGDDKSIRVTDKKADKIIEHIFSKFDLHRPTALCEWGKPEFMDFLAGVILRVMGDLDGAPERLKVVEALERNARLVWLREDMLPFNLNESVKDSIRDSVESVTPDRTRWNKKALLEGSKFKGGSSVPTGMDPFSFMVLPDEDPK